jgi:hypothetical protein
LQESVDALGTSVDEAEVKLRKHETDLEAVKASASTGTAEVEAELKKQRVELDAVKEVANASAAASAAQQAEKVTELQGEVSVGARPFLTQLLLPSSQPVASPSCGVTIHLSLLTCCRCLN